MPSVPMVFAAALNPKDSLHASVVQKTMRGCDSSLPMDESTNCSASRYKANASSWRDGSSMHIVALTHDTPAHCGATILAGLKKDQTATGESASTKIRTLISMCRSIQKIMCGEDAIASVWSAEVISRTATTAARCLSIRVFGKRHNRFQGNLHHA